MFRWQRDSRTPYFRSCTGKQSRRAYAGRSPVEKRIEKIREGKSRRGAHFPRRARPARRPPPARFRTRFGSTSGRGLWRVRFGVKRVARGRIARRTARARASGVSLSAERNGGGARLI
eukprot:31320-Pelagococcus_subviridis.AAC.2